MVLTKIRFLASVNFHGWFNERKQAALQQFNIIYRKMITEADIVSLQHYKHRNLFVLLIANVN